MKLKWKPWNNDIIDTFVPVILLRGNEEDGFSIHKRKNGNAILYAFGNEYICKDVNLAKKEAVRIIKKRIKDAKKLLGNIDCGDLLK